MIDVVFTMTSPACGEAYDATIDGEYVGRVRLRYGDLVARSADETELLRLQVSDDGLMGCFHPDLDMRDAYLMIAAEALSEAANREGDVFVTVENYFDWDNEPMFDSASVPWVQMPALSE